MPEHQSIEIWKDIADAPGYQVSDQGRVRSRCQGGQGPKKLRGEWRILRPGRLPSGYFQAYLYINGKITKRYVHRLVLEAFVGPCPDGQQARHVRDNDRSNNRADNLAWGTPQENSDDVARHGARTRGSKVVASKLTEADVASLMKECAAGATVRALSAKYGIRKENVSKIVNGHQWKHVEGQRKPREEDFPGHITSAEASVAIGISQGHVQELVRTGALTAVMCRRRLMVSRTSVEAEIARRVAALAARRLD